MAKAELALPVDLLHLIANELSDRGDFATLFNYIVSSKQLASSGAIAALYKISGYAPVKGGGDLSGGLAEQELVMQRWSILWRTVILSAFGKTIYPYCKHLLFLDLRDLGNMLDDDKFRGKISKNFFSDELAQFHYMDQTLLAKRRVARLDSKKIITAIGGLLTKQSPRLEALSEPTASDIFTNALLEWTPRLEHLKTLDFWDGKALADERVRNLLHVHCPNLSSLSIYISSNEDADESIAAFVSGMQGDTLTYFENLSHCHIGPQTCLALNHHGKSLRSLKLGLSEEGVLALALLQNCTFLEDLTITSFRASVDLKATQNDVYLEIVEWLRSCQALQSVSLTNFVSAPDLLLPILLNKAVSLQRLQINALTETATYAVKDHLDFHQALSEQPTLKSLLLRADSDQITRDGIETLVTALCALDDLHELNLTRVSDYFSSEHIGLLAKHLSKLEDLYIGGLGIGDEVWTQLIPLSNLKILTFSNITSFTVDGILSFIERLGSGNWGMQLSIDNADPESAIAQEGLDLIREAIMEGVDGRFEYQLARDPNVPEFDSDDDSD